ncbi:hypothetical protein SAMN05444377_101212 [Flavobacterium fontis]|uniref:Uncharacterized protein n=1 Tax=Flavobacterium fontis TaxID=1124188 RepID=A0A1M4W8J6_9FLAO|nr:hypothetical protein SAMN05444377_101212 [Flavobacterium fontis]
MGLTRPYDLWGIRLYAARLGFSHNTYSLRLPSGGFFCTFKKEINNI